MIAHATKLSTPATRFIATEPASPRRRRFFPLGTLCAFLLGALCSVADANGPGRPSRSGTDEDGEMFTLNQCYVHEFPLGGETRRVVVFFRTDYPASSENTLDENNIPDVDTDPSDGINDWAFNVARWTEEAWVTFDSLGFPPARRERIDDVDQIEVHLFDIGAGFAGWCCTSPPGDPYATVIEASLCRSGNESRVEDVIIHEIWHTTKFVGRGGWIDEGSAALMQDQTDAALDLIRNGFYGRAAGYLGAPDRGLTSQGYSGALWWKYFSERMGTITTEPQRGIDAMRKFYDDFDSADVIGSLDQTVRDLSGDTATLQTLFCDFNVANYVKDLPDPSLPPKYRYVDEEQAPGAYDFDNNPGTPPVALAVDLALTSGGTGGPTATGTLRPWAARYYRVRPDSSVPVIRLDFRQDSRRPVSFVLLKIRGGAVVEETRSAGPDFVTSISNDNYDEVVLVMTSFEAGLNYRYNVHGLQPVLQIVDPIEGRPAQAGDRSAPDKILLKFEVLDPAAGTAPVRGIGASEISASIGGLPAPSAGPLVEVGGQYWMLVQPPNQGSDNRYDLTLTWSSLTATEPQSVNYASRLDSDNVVLIDRSGSMGSHNKMESARNAARLYVDSWRTGDEIGMVSFNQDASDPADLLLQAWNATSRENAFVALDDLVTGGATSVGDALFAGLDELDLRGDDDDDWAFVVLSDGVENRDRTIAEFLDEYRRRVRESEKVPRVHSIAIGPDANRSQLQDLSETTNGIYLYNAEPLAPAPSPAHAPQRASAPDPVDLPNDLAEFYRIVAEHTEREQQIFVRRGEYRFGINHVHPIAIDSGATEAVFAVNWHGTGTPGPLTLRRPDGTLVASELSDQSHRLWRESTPMPGTWSLQIQCSIDEFCHGNYLVEAAVKSNLTLHGFCAPSSDWPRESGSPIQILALLTDTGPVSGAKVEARITVPEFRGALFSEPAEVHRLDLFDDGRHGDGAAGDGLFGNEFRRAHRGGSYDLTIEAEGKSALLGSFTRRSRKAFDLGWAVDSDLDGMPDQWESRHGLDPQVDDREADPDCDGLTNLEEYEEGTDPNNSDSDAGGENDGSETRTGGNPLEPSDDGIPPLNDFVAPHPDQHFVQFPEQSPYNGSAYLRFYAHPEWHERLILLRSEAAGGPYEVIDENIDPRAGDYFDFQVKTETPYFYKLIAVSGDDRESAVSGPVMVIPKDDAFGPEGFLVINEGVETTSQREVTLRIHASPDTVEMRLSNQASFADSEWEPFSSVVEWTLAAETPSGRLATVFLELRDDHHNHSDPLSASILTGTIQGESYQQWVLRYADPLDPLFQLLSDPTGDLDGDGLSHGGEWGFDTNPLVPNPGTDPRREQVMVIEVQEASYLAIRFRRRTGPGAPRYEAEFSPNLHEWKSGEDLIAQVGPAVDNHDGTETVTFRSTVPVGRSKARREFVRVRISGE